MASGIRVSPASPRVESGGWSRGRRRRRRKDAGAPTVLCWRSSPCRRRGCRRPPRLHFLFSPAHSLRILGAGWVPRRGPDAGNLRSSRGWSVMAGRRRPRGGTFQRGCVDVMPGAASGGDLPSSLLTGVGVQPGGRGRGGSRRGRRQLYDPDLGGGQPSSIADEARDRWRPGSRGSRCWGEGSAPRLEDRPSVSSAPGSTGRLAPFLAHTRSRNGTSSNIPCSASRP